MHGKSSWLKAETHNQRHTRVEQKDYIRQVSRQWQTGDATEHSYRGMLADYVQDIVGKGFVVVNEPSRINCGAPDYVILRASDHQPVFYIEAKDIDDNDLDGRNPKGHREQFDRYKGALEHIVFTDYLDFHFYEHGQWTRNIRLADIQGNKIVEVKDSEQPFTEQILQWSRSRVQPITGASRLADIMAQKARLLRHVTFRTMTLMADDPDDYQDSQLLQLFNAFRGLLVSDLTIAGFADMYAQTIVYGLFAARLHDNTPEDFSREEAARLIPKTNPFLRRIFNNIAGIDLDDRVAWIVDDLVETFAATDVAKVMKDYGRNDHRNDPMVHFYEDFLTHYDAQLRKDMGVWYTMKPVVGFIVRSVHELLKSLFNMPLGLADTSKITTKDKRQVHRLQILDIATGTATFIAEVIMVVYDVIGKRNAGLWQDYVEKELKPRLNGFEIMMAPYTIAHLKIDMVLHETGYDSTNGRRLNIFLTNSLEPPSPEPRTLFNAISMEAEEADKVKRDKPVMVIIGNPPYNGASRNQGKWIMHLMETYKTEPGGKVKLKERNPKWLNDDYVKFIRLAEYYVEKNGVGVIGFINPHGFIDNPTFRGMRWNLLKTFDRIYVLNLHGNSKKKEVCPDGSKDENVFDIMQGVSINLFVKTGEKKNRELGKVFYADLWGLRKDKFDFLDAHDVTSVEYKEVEPQEPMYYFMPINDEGKEEYDKGFKLDELFPISSMGITIAKDDIVVCDSQEGTKRLVADFQNLSVDDIRKKYHIQKETPNWSVSNAKNDLLQNEKKVVIAKYCYRPFDNRYVPYTGLSNGVICRPRYEQQQSLLHDGNLALCTIRVGRDYNFPIYIVDSITDKTVLSSKDNATISPLYIYKENMGNEEKVPNFKPEIFNRIANGLGMSHEELKPEDLLCYIYAVLHSPQYREKYKEFLKIDFPRVPYPKDKTRFNELVSLGRKLIDLHLMCNADTWDVKTGFPESGTNIVERYEFKPGGGDGNLGKVWINETQYFSDVSSAAWNTYIGGYQPAQKWLKDRRGRHLTYDDIIHYEHIIYVLDATESIMKYIDTRI